MEECVIVEGLRKTYFGRSVVKDISFTIQQGEVFGILGHNGAGKTTLVETMLGLKEADAGNTILLGEKIGSHSKQLFERIGVQLQHSGYQNNIKVKEVCEEIHVLYAHPSDVASLYEQFHMEAFQDQLVEKLSGGERQKLSLICALIPNPELLFLDELTTGLDPYARACVWDILRQRKEAGTTIVMTSHYLEEVEALCDRIMIMKEGACVFLGTIPEVLDACHVTTLAEAYLFLQKEASA